MKKIKLLIVVITILLSGKLFAQGMTPPEPVSSPLLESMVGTWISDPYELMGMKFTDEVTQSIILNGQFMKIEVSSKSDVGFNYEGLGIMALSKDGSITGWFFDIFGKNSITTYEGTSTGSMVSIIGKSPTMTEQREIGVDGDVMIQYLTWKMKDATGKELPDEKVKIIFNRKK